MGHPRFLLFYAFVGSDGCTFELCESRGVCLVDRCIYVCLVDYRVSVLLSVMCLSLGHRVSVLLIIVWPSCWSSCICLDYRVSALLIIVYLVDRLYLSSWSLCVCPLDQFVSVLITVLSVLLITVFHVSRYSAIQSNKTSPSLIVRIVSVDCQGLGVL